MARVEVLLDGLDHSEGVAYDPESGVLWAGGEEGQLYRVDLDSHDFEEAARACGLVLGVAVDLRGRAVVCCPGEGSVSAWDGHQFRHVVDGLSFPNYAAFTPDGTLFISNRPDGLAFTSDGVLLVSCYRPDRIYHLSPNGELEVVAEDPQGTLLAAPANVCFVGRSLDRVVAANYNRRHLTLLDLGLRGAPLHRTERWAADAR
jgi:sugar lactone lactonase YvrE